MFKALPLFTLVSNLKRSSTGASNAHHTRGLPLGYQKSSKFVQIPEEILLIIVDHLSLMERARLLRTCRYLHTLVEPIQYRHLNMTDPWLFYRTHGLHRTLSERPDLISRMVSYRGPLMPYTPPQPLKLKTSERLKLLLEGKQASPHSRKKVPYTETEPFRRAIFIFTNAVNLRELEFTNGTDWASNPNWEPVKATILKMLLTRLSLPINARSVDVVSLLRAQPGLEHLELSWVTGSFDDLKESDMPKLRSFKGTLNDAATIIPGRPVEEFCHVLETGEHALNEQLVSRLSRSTVPIRKFTTRLLGPRDHESLRSLLQMIARHLPEIEHLKLTVGGFISGQVLLDEIPSFRSLRSAKFLDADLLYQSHMSASTDADNSEGGGITAQIPVNENWNALLQKLQEK